GSVGASVLTPSPASGEGRGGGRRKKPPSLTLPPKRGEGTRGSGRRRAVGLLRLVGRRGRVGRRAGRGVPGRRGRVRRRRRHDRQRRPAGDRPGGHLGRRGGGRVRQLRLLVLDVDLVQVRLVHLLAHQQVDHRRGGPEVAVA